MAFSRPPAPGSYANGPLERIRKVYLPYYHMRKYTYETDAVRYPGYGGRRDG